MPPTAPMIHACGSPTILWAEYLLPGLQLLFAAAPLSTRLSRGTPQMLVADCTVISDELSLVTVISSVVEEAAQAGATRLLIKRPEIKAAAIVVVSIFICSPSDFCRL